MNTSCLRSVSPFRRFDRSANPAAFHHLPRLFAPHCCSVLLWTLLLFTILAVPPFAGAQTPWQKVFPGNTATFDVLLYAGLSHQWEQSADSGLNWTPLNDGGVYAGVTTATLSISGVNVGMSNLLFRAAVTDGSGTFYSPPAPLTVLTSAPGVLWTQIPPTLLPVTTPRAIVGNVVKVSAGSAHTMYIKNNGSLWATGLNADGQFGNGTTSTAPSSTPVQVTSGVASVAAGPTYTLYIKNNGTLWGTGGNGFGQLGDGTTLPRITPVQIASNVNSAAAGDMHSLYLKINGTLWATGNNASGQLGDGTNNTRSTPVQIATGVVAVAAGFSHTLFLKTDGTLWATGLNTSGQLGDGTNSNRTVPVQIATGVAGVSAGENHSMFIKTDGTLWGMGENWAGQLGSGTYAAQLTPVPIATGVAKVSAGQSHTLFLKTDGTLWGMGTNLALGNGSDNAPQVTPIQLGTGLASISAGDGYSMLINTGGVLLSTGENDSGELGDRQSLPLPPPVAAEVMSVSADTAANNLFVKSDGTLWQQSYSQVTQFAGVSGVIQAAAGSWGVYRCYLKSDGSLWSLESNGTSTLIDNYVVSAGAGTMYEIAYLKSDGTLWGLGGDLQTIQFGAGTVPVQVADQVVSLSTAGYHLLFVKADQTLWGMGQPWWGLVAGSYWGQYKSTPVQVETGVVAAFASTNGGNRYIKTDGTLWTRGPGWGSGTAELVDTDVLSASSGMADNLAGNMYLKADGILRFRSGFLAPPLGQIVDIASEVSSVSGGPASWSMYLQHAGTGTVPVITVQPKSATKSLGSKVTLQVTATGSGPMGYQWFKNGVAITWAQAAQYTIPYLQPGDTGTYTVVVANSAGVVTSNPVTVTSP